MANRDAQLNTTPYNEDELEHFKELLEDEQEQTQNEIETLKERINDLTSNKEDNNSGAAHHQGDIGSEEDEREKFLLMVEKQKEKMPKIKAAFDRIEMGTYGVCEQTGQKIQKERLEAIPYTRLSVGAKKGEEA